MKAATTTILATALVAAAAALLLVGTGFMTGPMSGTVTMSGSRTLGGGLSEYGGYLLLALIDIGLATIVAWMLFGNRDGPAG
jgi:hypothetical protein